MGTSYTVQQAINAAYLRATRKATGLDITSTKGVQILALLNFNQKDWANDPNNEWGSLRQLFTVPAVVSATDTYDLSSLTTLNRISKQEGDYIRITNAGGTKEWDYSIVDPSLLYNDGPILNAGGRSIRGAYGTVAQIGTSLVFDHPFVATDAQIGGTIKVPGYVTVSDLTTASQTIVCDDPQWLITKTAADYCFNDVTRINLYPALNDEAQEKYQDMVSNNESQIDTLYTPSLGIPGTSW